MSRKWHKSFGRLSIDSRKREHRKVRYRSVDKKKTREDGEETERGGKEREREKTKRKKKKELVEIGAFRIIISQYE